MYDRGRGRALGRYGAEMGSSKVFLSFFQVVDMLALHLPPEKLCPLLVSVLCPSGAPVSWYA